jgi:acyl-CoA thioesterase FadM
MYPTGHVNNVTYVRYAESGRVNLIHTLSTHLDPSHRSEWNQLITSKGNGLILRSIRTDYKMPLTFPDSITVLHKLARPLAKRDPDSITLDVVILSELKQRVAARCVEDIVFYDYKAQRKTPMKKFMADTFSNIWEEQEATKKTWERKMNEVEGRVREIELSTWDRPDAKEDLGSATD